MLPNQEFGTVVLNGEEVQIATQLRTEYYERHHSDVATSEGKDFELALDPESLLEDGGGSIDIEQAKRLVIVARWSQKFHTGRYRKNATDHAYELSLEVKRTVSAPNFADKLQTYEMEMDNEAQKIRVASNMATAVESALEALESEKQLVSSDS